MDNETIAIDVHPTFASFTARMMLVMEKHIQNHDWVSTLDQMIMNYPFNEEVSYFKDDPTGCKYCGWKPTDKYDYLDKEGLCVSCWLAHNESKALKAIQVAMRLLYEKYPELKDGLMNAVYRERRRFKEGKDGLHIGIEGLCDHILKTLRHAFSDEMEEVYPPKGTFHQRQYSWMASYRFRKVFLK